MQIEFDPDKRDKTLAERGLDFAQAGDVFAGVNVRIKRTPTLMKNTKRTPTLVAYIELKGPTLIA